MDLNTAKLFERVAKGALLLDRVYIPTRYPNGLPDLTPEEAFLEEDARACIENASKIIEAVTSCLAR